CAAFCASCRADREHGQGQLCARQPEGRGRDLGSHGIWLGEMAGSEQQLGLGVSRIDGTPGAGSRKIAGSLLRASPMTQRSHAAAAVPQKIRIAVDGDTEVSSLVQHPPDAQAVLVLAHGAGAGMTHPFLSAVAANLAERSIATLRYQFPYMERGSKRPD